MNLRLNSIRVIGLYGLLLVGLIWGGIVLVNSIRQHEARQTSLDKVVHRIQQKELLLRRQRQLLSQLKVQQGQEVYPQKLETQGDWTLYLSEIARNHGADLGDLPLLISLQKNGANLSEISFTVTGSFKAILSVMADLGKGNVAFRVKQSEFYKKDGELFVSCVLNAPQG